MDKRLQAFLTESEPVREKQPVIHSFSDDVANPINSLYSSNTIKCENKISYGKRSDALVAKNIIQKYKHNIKEKNLKAKDIDKLVVYRCVHCELYHVDPYNE